MKATELMIGDTTFDVSDYASQRNAILGIPDSGKTYTATLIAEQLDDAGVNFVAFDPIGVWRFLRHKGTGRGLEVVVAGGEHADIPLSVDNCEDIIRCAMREGISLVIDLFDFNLSKADWRRIVAKSARILLHENKRYGLRHIFLEEAAEFIPQNMSSEYATVYAELEKVARMGGNARLGMTIINQRAEQVNKAVLELCDCVILHRQKGRRSIQALEKWLSYSGSGSKQIVSTLPTLKQGQCYVWAGGEENAVLETVQTKRTLAPDRRAISEEGTPCSVASLVAKFPEFDVPARPEEPAKAGARSAEPEPEPVRIVVFADGSLAKMELLERQFLEHFRECSKLVGDIEALHRHIHEDLHRASQVSNQEVRRITDPPKPPVPQARDGKPLGEGHRKILSALASRSPLRLTFNQLGTVCIYTPSTMRTYMPRLRELRYVEENKDGIGITPAGMAFIGKAGIEKMPQGGAELLEFWMSKLSEGEGKILKTLAACGRRSIDIATLMERTSYTSSTLKTYLPTLRRNGLIDPTELRAMPEFYQ